METQPADPRAKQRALALVVAATLIGLPVLWLLDAELEAIATLGENDLAAAGRRLREILGWFGVVVAVPALLISGYLRKIGAATVASERFPPPGVAVIRDTAVRVGSAARLRGRAMEAGSVLLLLLVMASLFVTWQLADILERQTATKPASSDSASAIDENVLLTDP